MRLAAVSLLAVMAFSDQGISRAAADRCRAKVNKLEGFTPKAGQARTQQTRFTQEEINSYLALDLRSKYGPGLESLEFIFQEARLQGDAVIDFDSLGMRSTKLLGKLMASMFSGIHRLSVRGKVVAEGGKAYFQLEEAKFDSTSLPNFLVEEIITAVGRKQRPPFDPLQPSQMPYRIERVEMHPGLILVYQ